MGRHDDEHRGQHLRFTALQLLQLGPDGFCGLRDFMKSLIAYFDFFFEKYFA